MLRGLRPHSDSRRSRRADRWSPTGSYLDGRHVDGQILASAPHGHRQAVIACRPELRKLPSVRVVVELRRKADRGRKTRAANERELAQWQREAETARLDVRLLQRPVIEKHHLLLVFGQRAQVEYFLRREEA